MDPQQELKAAHRTVSLIGISIVASLFIYLALAEIIRAVLRPFRGFVLLGDPQRIRYAFFAGAIVAVILIRVMRQALLRRSASDLETGIALRRIQRASVITIVLCEIPAFLGLVLFLLAGLNVDFYLLLFVSLVLIFMYFPRLSHWREMMGG